MAEGDADTPPASGEEPRLKGRLDDLSAALAARRVSPVAQDAPNAASGNAMGAGLRAASELVGGILVGGFIGWSLDAWLGTKPWLSIVFFLLGVVGGFWNVMRSAFRTTVQGPPNGDGDQSSRPGA